MRRLSFFACCALLCTACNPAELPAGTDVGPELDASDAAERDAAASDARLGDAGQGEPGLDGGDAGAVLDAGDAASIDAGHDLDAYDDTNAVVMQDAGAFACAPRVHLTGSPLGASYDWTDCGGSDAPGSAASWTYDMINGAGGIAFFRAPSIAAGAAGQAFVGTYVLPSATVPAPVAIVCSGSSSTLDVDDAGLVTGFSFRHATTLHTAGTSATGGLVIAMGATSAVFDGDIGTHHFASATAIPFGVYDENGAYMTLQIGTTALSLTLVRYVDTIMLGILQIGSGSTTDVYLFDSGSATDTTITLPATTTLLGTCDGAATASASLDGTIAR